MIFLEWIPALNVLVLVGRQWFLVESFLPQALFCPLRNFAFICYLSTLTLVVDEPCSIASDTHEPRSTTLSLPIKTNHTFPQLLAIFLCMARIAPAPSLMPAESVQAPHMRAEPPLAGLAWPRECPNADFQSNGMEPAKPRLARHGLGGSNALSSASKASRRRL